MINAYWTRYSSQRLQLHTFIQLKVLLAGLIEMLILLDRLVFLQQSVCSSSSSLSLFLRIVRLFAGPEGVFVSGRSVRPDRISASVVSDLVERERRALTVFVYLFRWAHLNGISPSTSPNDRPSCSSRSIAPFSRATGDLTTPMNTASPITFA